MPTPPPPESVTALRGAVALAGTREPVVLAALLDWPLHAVIGALDDLAAHGDDDIDGDGDGLAAATAWLRASPAAAGAAIERALGWLLGRGERAAAARVAQALGTTAQIAAVLEQAGWALMHGPERALAGALLDRVALAMPGAAPGLSPRLRWLRLAWRVEVERQPHEAQRALQADTVLGTPHRRLLSARMAQMYDLPHDALADARAAVAAFGDDLDPEGQQALLALGFALLEAGFPRDAIEPLQRLARAADRDATPLLQLDALHVLARVHDELGDAGAVRRTLAAARAPAAQAPASLPARQGLERLRRALTLRHLDATVDAAVDAASDPVLAEPLAPREPDDAYTAFPQLGLDAVAALQAGDLAGAAARLDTLDDRLAHAFHCRKWRLEHGHARLWLAARRGDVATLQRIAADAVPTDARATLYDLQHAVLALAAAALAGQPVADAATRLAQRLADAGLARQQRRLVLVHALDPGADPVLLGGWLAAAAADGDVQDARWLAPKLAARLDAWLASPAAAHDAATRALAQRLLGEMLAPVPAGTAAMADTPARPLPADLTPREWEILQLIGARLSNVQIAARLYVSVATVKTHINRVYGKLGITSRAEAVQRARDLA